MSASLLAEEPPAITSGYAWLISEASQHDEQDPGRLSGDDVLDGFDELVAARIVARIQQSNTGWSLRTTGEVVLDVLEQVALLNSASLPIPARELVRSDQPVFDC